MIGENHRLRRRPLTAKVRRGLAHAVPLISVNIDNGDGGDFQHLTMKETDDVRAALLWIEQFAATTSNDTNNEETKQ